MRLQQQDMLPATRTREGEKEVKEREREREELLSPHITTARSANSESVFSFSAHASFLELTGGGRAERHASTERKDETLSLRRGRGLTRKSIVQPFERKGELYFNVRRQFWQIL